MFMAQWDNTFRPSTDLFSSTDPFSNEGFEIVASKIGKLSKIDERTMNMDLACFTMNLCTSESYRSTLFYFGSRWNFTKSGI